MGFVDALSRRSLYGSKLDQVARLRILRFHCACQAWGTHPPLRLLSNAQHPHRNHSPGDLGLLEAVPGSSPVPLGEAMALTGHRSVQTFLRYFKSETVQNTHAATLMGDSTRVVDSDPNE